MDGLRIAVHLFQYGVHYGYEYLGGAVHYAEQGLRRVFDDGFYVANGAVMGIFDFPAFYLVEVELVAGEFGEHGEGQVHIVSYQGERFLGTDFVKLNHGAVAVEGQALDEVGDKVAFDFDEYAVKFGIAFGLVDVEE